MSSRFLTNVFGLNNEEFVLPLAILFFNSIKSFSLFARYRALLKYPLISLVIKSSQPISFKILPATLLANVSPDMVKIGQPAHNASLAEV